MRITVRARVIYDELPKTHKVTITDAHSEDHAIEIVREMVERHAAKKFNILPRSQSYEIIQPKQKSKKT